MFVAAIVVAHRFEDPDVLYRAGVSSESEAAFLARFFAFGRCVLWRPVGGNHHRLFPDAALETAVVEDCGRVRAWNRAGKCLRQTRLFLSRMLLGQANESSLGHALHRTRTRSHWRANRCEAASHAALRIVRHANRFLFLIVAAQEKEIQWPGDIG